MMRKERTQMTRGALLTMTRFGGTFTKQAREPILSMDMIQANRMKQMTEEVPPDTGRGAR
jgi:hypothetical protein